MAGRRERAEKGYGKAKLFTGKMTGKIIGEGKRHLKAGKNFFEGQKRATINSYARGRRRRILRGRSGIDKYKKRDKMEKMRVRARKIGKNVKKFAASRAEQRQSDF